MGATFFMLLMAVIFLIALFFSIINVIILVLQIVRKRRGKTVKKRWIVIPIIFLVISILAQLIPLGFVASIRIVNSKGLSEKVFAESGKMIYWPMGKYEPSTNWFEMDGVKYVQFREGFSTESFFLSSIKDKRGKPVSNITYNPAHSGAFNSFMIWLLTGNSYENVNISTIYPIINENSFELYEVNGRAFCPETKLSSIKAYYSEISNYETRNLICRYSIYSDKESLNKRWDTPYINIEKSISLRPETFEELSQMNDKADMSIRVDIPEKYIELDKAAKPGTPIFGYDQRELLLYSKDKMAYRHVYLVLIEGQVYVEQDEGNKYINGYILTEKMNQYIKETVFLN